MVEADGDIASVRQGLARGRGLAQTLGRAGQGGGVDQRLPLGEPGRMGVAENGQPARGERGCEFGGVDHVFLGLVGQAIHQVEIDGAEARDAQQAYRALDNLEGLDAANGLLHMRIEILHAEADAVERRPGKRKGEIAVDMTRVEFDRNFGLGQKN